MPESNIPIIIDDFRQIYEEAECKRNLFILPRREQYMWRDSGKYTQKNCAGAMCQAQLIIRKFPLFFAATESLVQGHDVGQLVVFVGYDTQLGVQQRLLCCQEFKIRTVG